MPIANRSSSTWWDVNGDGGLSFTGKAHWLTSNAVNLSTSCIYGVGTSRLRPSFEWLTVLDSIAQVEPSKSPARVWSDSLWQMLSWHEVESVVGPPNILEIGCGTGSLGRKIATAHPTARYLGLDVKYDESWEQAGNLRTTFRQLDAQDLGKVLSGQNVVISQSSLEHIGPDAGVMRTIGMHYHESGEPLLMIHLVPSPVCMWLYPGHGIRQYSAGILARLGRYLGPGSRQWVAALGGLSSSRFLLGRNLESRGLRSTSTDPSRNLSRAFSEDLNRHQPWGPVFLAWIVAVNVRFQGLESLRLDEYGRSFGSRQRSAWGVPVSGGHVA